MDKYWIQIKVLGKHIQLFYKNLNLVFDKDLIEINKKKKNIQNVDFQYNNFSDLRTQFINKIKEIDPYFDTSFISDYVFLHCIHNVEFDYTCDKFKFIVGHNSVQINYYKSDDSWHLNIPEAQPKSASKRA
jgi:hypothetical protein